MTNSPTFSIANLLNYGLFGLPLAMVALPIYIFVPQFYALHTGISLSIIGLTLLITRVIAALTDPILGWLVQRGGSSYGRYLITSLPLLLGGFAALFHPPSITGVAALAWFICSLLVVYLGFGLATIAHQSWGAALTQEPQERVRLSAVREGFSLIGVIIAAGLSGTFGYNVMSFIFSAFLLLTGFLLLTKAPRPISTNNALAQASLIQSGLLEPFKNKRYRALFCVLLVNGLAAAIPATLFLFFANDKLRLGSYSGPFLILYFLAAALSMPVWVAISKRLGEAKTWVLGMLTASIVFVWAYGLDVGAIVNFGLVCFFSGIALGADLALPPALLTGVIAKAGHSGKREAAYFGWWNWGVQITLALAAGITLPLLEWQGYVPGQQIGLTTLSAAYALLPCALKLFAAWLLWRAPLRDC